MEAVIKNRMLILPPEVLERLEFPREGRCKVEVTGEGDFGYCPK